MSNSMAGDQEGSKEVEISIGPNKVKMGDVIKITTVEHAPPHRIDGMVVEIIEKPIKEKL